MASETAAAKVMTKAEATAFLMAIVGAAINKKVVQVRPRPRMAGSFLAWMAFAREAKRLVNEYGAGLEDVEMMIDAGKDVYRNLIGKDPDAPDAAAKDGK